MQVRHEASVHGVDGTREVVSVPQDQGDAVVAARRCDVARQRDRVANQRIILLVICRNRDVSGGTEAAEVLRRPGCTDQSLPQPARLRDWLMPPDSSVNGDRARR